MLINFKKSVLSLIVLLLLTNTVFSQVDPVGNFNRHVFENWKGEAVRIGQYRVKGSPYLLGESFPGNINYKSGRVLNNAKVLYDIYNQKAGIDLKNEIYVADDPIESFSISLPETMGGKKLLFKNSYLFGKPDMKGFFNVLEDGNKVVFLKVYKSRLVADPTNNMDTKLKVFEQFFDYYFYVKSTKALNSLKLRKKDIIKELGNEQFISEYNSADEMDFTKEAQVITLINAYNSSL